ncbi:universal stress protein [Acerihabitans sp. TG2]|uniref:universal stress protein n=1 Tax=Acerihabitans sp. TG2 TaxID=3096008 RepID=UPI002B234245|nr:universal stress protein [Acerihabitans sp. TG2]MEA9390147.1 universal stress protein [Acerihabitans sp. TG2]
MATYTHALVLIHDETNGLALLQHVAALLKTLGAKITLCHLSNDYRPMNAVSDGRMEDTQSKEVIGAKDMLSRVVEITTLPVEIAELVTIHRFKDVEKFIEDNGIDVVIAGHKNRFMGTYTSWSTEFINHLSIDMLIHHL